MFNNREEEAKREKERERKAKYALLAAAIKEISPAQVIPERGLRLPPDPASDATSQDTGQRHAQTRSPPQKCAQSVLNGDTGK